MNLLSARLLAILAAICCVVGVTPANLGALELPGIDLESAAYRERILAQAAETAERADIETLRHEAKLAQSESRWEDWRRISERIVSANPDDYFAWISLATAWRANDMAAVEISAAAYQAWSLAHSQNERTEALLLLIENLRRRQNEQLVDKALEAAGDVISERAIAALLPPQPQPQAAEGASAPAFSVTEIKPGVDRRSPVTGEPAPFACALFTAELDSRNAEHYRDFVDLRVGQDSHGTEDYRIRVWGQKLCVMELKLGTGYSLSLRAGLPARDGSTLANDVAARLKPMLGLHQVTTRLDESPPAGHPVPVVCASFTAALDPDKTDRYREHLVIRNKGGDELITGYEIQVDKRQLCILGLDFGTWYELQFLAGLTAHNGSELPSDADAMVTIDSIPPQVSFRGQALLLPARGEGLVPVSTINVAELELTLLRIGDRNLINEIALGKLGGKIDAADVVHIRDSTGEIVWRGSLAIQHQPDTPVLTGLPVRDLTDLHHRLGEKDISDDPQIANILPGILVDDTRIGAVDPGVYALIARDAVAAAQDRDFSIDAENEVQLPVQWLAVTDLGISLFKSRHDLLTAIRSLSDGKPREEVKVQLVSKNNRVLAEAVTDAHGIARFDGNLARGTLGNALAGVLAFADDGDFAFLDATTDMLDLGDRGVEGRAPAAALDAYVYFERGIYRPGETVNATILVRDSAGTALDPQAMPPLTYSLLSANGREILTGELVDPKGGGYHLDFEVPDTGLSGLWRLAVRLGRGSEEVGNASFEVGPFLPGRIDLKLEPVDQQALTKDSPMRLKLTAEYLYGAPASDLPGEALVEIRQSAVPWAATRYTGFPSGLKAEDFAFGLEDEEVASRRTRLDLLRTDERGRATVPVRAEIPESTQPLEALVEVQLFDTDGSRTKEKLRAPVRSERDWIGIHKRVAFPRNGSVDFDLLFIDADGTPLPARALDVRVYRLRDSYVWQTAGGNMWRYEPQPQVSLLWEGSGMTKEDGMASVQVPIGVLGRFLIEARDGKGAATSLRFDSGWTGVPDVPAQPDNARLMLDRPSYAPGDSAHLSIEAPFSGEGLFLVGNERIRHWVTAPVEATGTDLRLDIQADWEPCAYVMGSVFRTNADASRERGPGRAIGLAHFCVAESERRLKATFPDVPLAIRAKQKFETRLKVEGIAPGEEAYATIALVDVGILGLTDYDAPKPEGHFFGKRKLGVDIYDVYDRVILSEGIRGTLRSGGGYGQLRGLRYASPIILSQFSGILPVGPDATAVATFDIPEFAGKVKLMAAVWSAARFGSVQQDVSVGQQPVQTRLQVPRFLAPGDLATATLQVHNRFAREQPYQVEISLKGPLMFSDRSKHMLLETPSLRAGDIHRKPLEITSHWAGSGTIEVKVTGTKDGYTYLSSQSLNSRLAHPELTRRFAVLLPPHGSIDLAKQFKDRIKSQFMGENISLSMRLSPDTERLAGLEPRAWLGPAMPHLNSLVAYGQLLLPEIAPKAVRAAGGGDRDAIQKVVQRISGLQTSYGFFRAVRQERVGEEETYDKNRIAQTIAAADVLIAARNKGLVVPESTLRSVISFVQKRFREDTECENGSKTWRPSAAYVLVRADQLKRFDLDDLDRCGPLPEDLVGIGYAAATHCLFGLTDQCRRQFGALAKQLRETAETAASSDAKAIILALMMESGMDDDLIAPLRKEVSHAILSPRASGELSLLARAALNRAFSEATDAAPRDFDVKIGGSARTVADPVYRLDDLRLKDLQSKLVVENLEPDNELALELLVRGVPLLGGESDTRSFIVERRFYDLDGNILAPASATLAAGQLLVVEVEGKVNNKLSRKVVLVNLMPGGLDVEETELLEHQPLSTKLREALSRPTDKYQFATVSLRERRDDRFVAILDFGDPRKSYFRARFLARALAAGEYALPEVLIEDLDQPEMTARSGAGRIKIVPNTTGP